MSVFELYEEALAELRVLSFEGPDEGWLDFVSDNRTGGQEEDCWDVVAGPVANDQTMPTLVLYLDGYLTKRQAIDQLLPQRLKDQVVFKSNAALSLLRFIEVIML